MPRLSEIPAIFAQFVLMVSVKG